MQWLFVGQILWSGRSWWAFFDQPSIVVQGFIRNGLHKASGPFAFGSTTHQSSTIWLSFQILACRWAILLYWVILIEAYIERYDNDTREELDELKFWSDGKEWSDEGKKWSDIGRMMVDAPTSIPHFQTFFLLLPLASCIDITLIKFEESIFSLK